MEKENKSETYKEWINNMGTELFNQGYSGQDVVDGFKAVFNIKPQSINKTERITLFPLQNTYNPIEDDFTLVEKVGIKRGDSGLCWSKEQIQLCQEILNIDPELVRTFINNTNMRR